MKKGFVFTFISILFVSVILIAFYINATNVTRVKTEESRVKVDTMNAFLKSIRNTHINSAVKVSTARALGAMVECILANQGGDNKQKLYANSQQALISIMEDSTLNYANSEDKNDVNKQIHCGTAIKNRMAEDGAYAEGDLLFHLPTTLTELIKAADNIGLDLDFNPATPEIDFPVPTDLNTNPYNIIISQTDPWNVHVTADLPFKLKTKDNTIIFHETTYKVSTDVNILGIEDPLYAAFEAKRSPVSKWDGVDLKKMIDGAKFYDPIAQGRASYPAIKPPSYIERFDKDDFNDGKSACCGIETLKEPSKKTLTWVDYLQYQSADVTGDLCSGNPTGYSIRLDIPHKFYIPGC